jgi:acyl-coenzyme A thioesterase 13
MNPILEYLQAHLGQRFSEGPSALGRWLDGTLVAAEEGALTADFQVRDEMLNPAGLLHGGVIAAIMDDLIGAAVYTLGQQHLFVSLNLNVDYLYGARLGETVRARAEVVKQGKKIMHVDCRLTNADGRLLAKGTSNLIATGTTWS